MKRKHPSSTGLGQIPGWLLIAIGATLSTGLGIAARWSQAKASGNTELTGIYEGGTAIGATSFCVLALLVLFQFQPGLRRSSRLRILFPDSSNHIVRLDPQSRSALRNLLGNSVKGLPFLTVGLIVNPTGLEFWGGSSHPRQLGIVGWRDVQKLSVSRGEYARRTVDKFVVEPSASSPSVSVPIGATVGLGWGFESPEYVKALAEKSEAYHRASLSA